MRATTLTAAALTAVVATACGSNAYGSQSGVHPAATGAGSSTAQAARGATVRLAKTSAGRMLVNSHGFTLYMFTSDGRNRDHCVKVSGCTGVWPLLMSRHPTAGPGVNRHLLGTIRVSGGRQVTYAGHPLYTYVGDSGPGDTGYIGFPQFGGTWYGVSASGHAVH